MADTLKAAQMLKNTTAFSHST